MRQKPGTEQNYGEKIVKDIRLATRKQYSAEEKNKIVLDGLKGEGSIEGLCSGEAYDLLTSPAHMVLTKGHLLSSMVLHHFNV